jgi:hypothetical protein
MGFTSKTLEWKNGTNKLMNEECILATRSMSAMTFWSPKCSCLWGKSANGLMEVPYIRAIQV